MRKGLKWIGSVLLLLVVAYNSVYFKKLDEVKASSTRFDSKSYAKKFFTNKLNPSLNNAVEINQLVTLILTNKEQAFHHSNALGIGNIRYFLVKGEGLVTAVNENDVAILSKTDSTERKFQIATEFVFGNAIRDASGKIDINEFNNTMDFNSISSELNKIVRTEVLPPFKSAVKKGDKVQFAGALEMNKEHLNLNDIEIIPIKLKLVGQ